VHNEDEEIEHLKAKVDSGADFIVTQLFYDVDNFLRWPQKIRARGTSRSSAELTCPRAHQALGITVPVIPGVLPIQTYASFVRVTKLCGTYIPDAIQADLEPIKVSLTYYATSF
jgi:methylenetetrahydrofolate reductase (NADPH)